MLYTNYKCQTQRTTDHMIPIVSNSGKCKTKAKESRLGVI